VTRPNRTEAPKGATGTCRDRRRPQGERRPAWVRPFERVHRALDASERWINSSIRTAVRSGRCAHRRPIGSSQSLFEAETRLVTASARLTRAALQLAEANECIARDPESAAGATELLAEAMERWIFTARQLSELADHMFALHDKVLEGLESGAFPPELPPGRRPRIILAPRPVPIRAFLAARRSRVTDRISAVLRRRRRTPRPAALSVPPRTAQGRAPPFSPLCPL